MNTNVNIQDLDLRTRCNKKKALANKQVNVQNKKGADSLSVSTGYIWYSRQSVPTLTAISFYRLLEILSKNIHFNPMPDINVLYQVPYNGPTYLFIKSVLTI